LLVISVLDKDVVNAETGELAVPAETILDEQSLSDIADAIYIINDDKIGEIPLILETIDESIWEDEIKILRNLEKEKL